MCFDKSCLSQDTKCPISDNCYTLDKMAFHVMRGNWKLNNTTELQFLPGQHTLSSQHSVQIHGRKHNLTLKPASQQQYSPSLIDVHSVSRNSTVGTLSPSILCNHLYKIVGFTIENVSELRIEGIQLYNCEIDCENSIKVTMTRVLAQTSYFTASTISEQLFHNQMFVDSQVVLSNSTLVIQNCTFTSSQNEKKYTSNTNTNIRYIHGSQHTHLSVENSTFLGATHTAVYLLSSTLAISGNTVFSENSGKQGGAVALHESLIILLDEAKVSFLNNHATSVGGAIFATNDILDSYIRYPVGPSRSISECHIICGKPSGITVSFINNTANDGGSATYGVTLSVCWAVYCNARNLQKIFRFEPDEPSLISSDPLRVCICQNNIPNCSIQNQTYVNVFPGDSFEINLTVVGFLYGTVRSTIVATLWHQSSTSKLGTDYEESKTIFGCTPVQYTVYSNRSEEVLVLATPTTSSSVTNGPLPVTVQNEVSAMKLSNHLPQNAFQSALFVRVGIQECPPGFERSAATPVHCKCVSIVEQNGLQCNITSQTITRSGTVWLGYSNNHGVTVHKLCPFGYCRSELVSVHMHSPDTNWTQNRSKLYSPDVQCTQNRSGVLCGRCETGLSIALGNSRCIRCTNPSIALLLVFITAGVLLVLLIKVLNLTVSVGTINGLIFYANIVGANQATFFPSGHMISKILTVFISWLNLDLGIETCFFNGLDSYWKTWLQFVFPLYIWSIAIVIIIISNRSTRFTRLVGSNSVPVLATLLLLSYSKLLRTSIAVFSFAQINYQDGSKYLAWAVDGNVQYLGQKHVILFTVSGAAVIGLWMPYTIILLSGNSIRKCTSYKRLSWMLKLQLFFDAYHGPFNYRHVHWVGTLLVARAVLPIVFAAFFATETSINLLSITLCTVTLMMYTPLFGFAYKEKWLTALECSFLLNLTVLSSGTLYIELTGSKGKDWLVGISVGVAILQFLGILVYHSVTFTFKHAQMRVISKLKAMLNSRANFIRLETTSEEALNELDIDAREAEAAREAPAVTETVIDPPQEEQPLSKMLGHDRDQFITGTVYTT